MKKAILATMLAIAAPPLAAAIPAAWTNSPGMPPYSLPPYPHGVPVDFTVTLRGYSDPPAAPGADVRLWYQTNGMGAAWWSAPATLEGDTIKASFTPDCDTGADRVSLFFGAPSNVFASAVLRLTHSPGFAPSMLPLPVQALDFAAVELRNIFALTNGWHFGGGEPGDYANVSNRAMNAVLWDSSMEYQEGHNSLNLGYAGLNWWEQIKLEPVWSGDGNGVRFAQEISPGGWQESELYPDGSPIATSNMAERIARQYAGSGGGGEPGDYANVSNRAMNAVTTNANGTAEIFGSKYGLFLHPDYGQIEWEGPDVSAYVGLPKRSGTFALLDDIPSTNGLFCVNKQAALPDGFAYIYGTMWQSSLYSVNLGFEFDANSCNYILPPPEYPEQNVYLASTNYVQKTVATATNYTDRAVALARAAKDYHWDAAQGVLYRTDFDGGYVYLTPVTNINALAEGNESILEYLEAHRND